MSQWVKWVNVKEEVRSRKISYKKSIFRMFIKWMALYQQFSSCNKKMSGFKIPCEAEGL